VSFSLRFVSGKYFEPRRKQQVEILQRGSVIGLGPGCCGFGQRHGGCAGGNEVPIQAMATVFARHAMSVDTTLVTPDTRRFPRVWD